METGDHIKHEKYGQGRIVGRAWARIPKTMHELTDRHIYDEELVLRSFITLFRVHFDNGKVCTFNKDTLDNEAVIVNKENVESTSRTAFTTEEVEARLYQLLIQQRDVDEACQFLKDAIADRNGNRTEKERDFSTLESIKINHRETYYLMQHQLLEYFGIKLEQVIEDQYKTDDKESSTISAKGPLTNADALHTAAEKEDAKFMADFLCEPGGLNEHVVNQLEDLRRNRPKYFGLVSTYYHQRLGKNLGEVMESFSNSSTSDSSPRLNAVLVEYIVNARGEISKSGAVPYRPEIGDRKKKISMEHHYAGTIFTVTSSYPKDCTTFGSEYFLPLDENVALDAAKRYEDNSGQ